MNQVFKPTCSRKDDQVEVVLEKQKTNKTMEETLKNSVDIM